MGKKIKLFCIPYGGASSYMYYPFSNYLKKHIDLQPIDLAGTGSRVGEDLYPSFNALVDDVINSIVKEKDLNEFALFGYCMGGLVIYEIARKLFYKFNIRPKALFIAACRAPSMHMHTGYVKIFKMNDRLFIKNLIKLGVIAPDVTNNKEILALMLPVLRANYKILGEYKYHDSHMPLPFRFIVLYSDDENKNDNIREWDNFSTNTCEYFHFNDGHFFINKHINSIADIINEKL